MGWLDSWLSREAAAPPTLSPGRLEGAEVEEDAPAAACVPVPPLPSGTLLPHPAAPVAVMPSNVA